MGNLHFFLAQIAAEMESSTHRLPPEQAAADRKPQGINEVVSERSARIDASDMNLKLWPKIFRQNGKLTFRTSGLKCVHHEKQVDRRIGGILRLILKSMIRDFGSRDTLLARRSGSR